MDTRFDPTEFGIPEDVMEAARAAMGRRAHENARSQLGMTPGGIQAPLGIQTQLPSEPGTESFFGNMAEAFGAGVKTAVSAASTSAGFVARELGADKLAEWFDAVADGWNDAAQINNARMNPEAKKNWDDLISGKRLTATGVLYTVANAFGSFAPIVAAGLATGGLGAAGAGVATVSGGMMQDSRQIIEGLVNSGEITKLPLYNEYRSSGLSEAEAIERVKQDYDRFNGAAGLVLGALQGGLVQGLTKGMIQEAVRNRLGRLAQRNMATRLGTGLVVGAAGEAAQEAAEFITPRALIEATSDATVSYDGLLEAIIAGGVGGGALGLFGGMRRGGLTGQGQKPGLLALPPPSQFGGAAGGQPSPTGPTSPAGPGAQGGPIDPSQPIRLSVGDQRFMFRTGQIAGESVTELVPVKPDPNGKQGATIIDEMGARIAPLFLSEEGFKVLSALKANKDLGAIVSADNGVITIRRKSDDKVVEIPYSRAPVGNATRVVFLNEGKNKKGEKTFSFTTKGIEGPVKGVEGLPADERL